MTKPVLITADSTCDLSAELLREFNIKTTPLTIQLGDKSYQDGVDFSPAIMYERYRAEGILPTTSAPNIPQFIDFFTPFIEAGYEVVHLDISSDLSSTFANARLAASELEGVYTVDSRMLSSGVALLAIEGSKLRDEGKSAAEIAKALEELTDKVDTSFVLDTLEFLHKGGRCSALAAMGANLLNLKPALEMKDGKLGVYKKFRGSTEKVYAQYIKDRMAGKTVRPEHIFITHSGEVSDEKTAELEALVKELVPGCRVHHALAGCTISSHCGPKCLGVLFINK